MARRILPGFPLALGITLVYVSIIVVLPLGALVFKAASLGFEDYWRIVSSPRAVASYRVTALSALAATVFNLVFGMALAWVLVRYRFPGRRFIDALVDLPFALPTAVAGIALTTLFAENGWFGSVLAQAGIKVAYSPLGIMVAMAFTSLPFVVRTVQPVLEDLGSGLIDPEDHGCSDADCREEGVGASVVSGGDASPVLELGEQVFDSVALAVDILVVEERDLPASA